MGYSAYPPAASGPTLAEIETAVSTYSTPYNGTWTDLGITRANGGISSVTVSGLGGYKELRMQLFFSPSTTSYITMRLNGDTGANYGYVNTIYNSIGSSYITTGMRLNQSSGAELTSLITISPANSTTAKKSIAAGSNHAQFNALGNFHGLWYNTSAVTSVTFALNTGTFSDGWIQIWGIN